MSPRALVYRTAKVAYLTPDAFAEHFGVSRMTVYRLITAGEIRANRLGRSLRIPITELERFTAATLIDPEVDA